MCPGVEQNVGQGSASDGLCLARIRLARRHLAAAFAEAAALERRPPQPRLRRLLPLILAILPECFIPKVFMK